MKYGAATFTSKSWKTLGIDILPYREIGCQELLDQTSINLCEDSTGLVQNCDIIFVPIQTPHDPRFEGITLC